MHVGGAILAAAVGLLMLCSGTASAQELAVEHDLEVPMPDGAVLKADVYRPAGEGPFPVVFVRTPYVKGQFDWFGQAMAAHGGYAVVIQDVRGQVASEGQFQPFTNERGDGLASLDWIAEQPWCDGNVGMWGSSYLSYCALLLTTEKHPALKTVVNISGWGNPDTMGAPGGVMHLMLALPWTLSQQIHGEREQIDYDEIFGLVPVSRIAELAGIDSPAWEGYFQDDESSFESSESTDGRYGDVDIPILHVVGWNDFLAASTLEVYEGIREARGDGAPFQKLMVGPLAHDMQWDTVSVVGDEDFGPESTIGSYKLIEMSIMWFHRYLRGIPTGVDQEPPAKIFLMGANEWRHFDHWPPETEETLWWLESGGSANTAAGDGTLLPEDEATPGHDTFVFDPMDPVPTYGGANMHFFPDKLGPRDQSEIEKRDDVLCYTSAPLESDTDIVGHIGATIYASTEGKSTDFTAKLVVVRPDGYARIVTEGIKRDPDVPEEDENAPMVPGKVYPFTIDLGATAIRVPAGHQLRLEVSSSNFPKYTRNPNTGEAAELAEEFRAVSQNVYHDEEFASVLRLPVLR
jgi:putative CocE/NonD family hydrolase